MAERQNTVERVAQEFILAFRPLTEAASDGPAGLALLAADANIDFETVFTDDAAIESVTASLAAVETVFDQLFDDGTFDPDLGDIDEIVDAVEASVGAVETLASIDPVPESDIDPETAAMRLRDHLLVEYLRVYRSRLYAALSAAEAIQTVSGDPPGIDPTESKVIVYDRLFDALTASPGDVAASLALESGWFDVYQLLGYAQEALEGQGLPTAFDYPRPATLEPYGVDIEQVDLGPALDTVLLETATDAGEVRVGVTVYPLTGSDGTIDRVLISPWGIADTDMSADLSDDWTFEFGASAALTDIGILVSPDGVSVVNASNPSDALPEFDAAAAVRFDGEESPFNLLSTGASRLDIRSLAAELGFEADADGAEFRVSIPATGVLVVEPQGGFLETVIPEPFEAPFEVTVIWSSETGLGLDADGSLDVELPQHVDFGFGELSAVTLGLDLPDADGSARATATATVEIGLGPLTARADSFGLDVALSAADDGTGALGPLDVDVGFKPPGRIGIDVDAGAVTGGGVLDLDPATESYAGAVELQVGPLGLSAVSLLTTRLPDGGSGFSLLVIVSGEFPPVQLGFGFTLNAVGGLIGVNRRLHADPLRDAIRGGRADSILFPENVVANADRIISDVSAIFPPARDSFVFGPMVRLGWSTPPVLTADLGVVLELPRGRVFVLGAFDVALPNQEVSPPAIDLHLDVVGEIDIPGKRLAVDAALYDSRVVNWSVDGQMALRSSWGKEPAFLLAVGGFHPAYDAPTGFPTLDRVRVSLDVPGGNPVVELTGYFAVTSNTLQVGAQAYAAFEAGPFSAKGTLGFDALFYLDPFRFLIDVAATLDVRVEGFSLVIDFAGSFSGPTPYRLRGRISVDIGPLSFSANANVALGEEPPAEPLPRATILPELVAALDRSENWSAALPAGGTPLVSLRRSPSDAEGEVAAHPLGTLTVRQTVVPLEYRIDRFGGAVPSTHDSFRIAAVRIGGQPVPDRARSDVLEPFAPGQYRSLTTAEKLSGDDFVDLAAGTTVVDTGTVHGGQTDSANVTRTRLSYEQRVPGEHSEGAGETVTARSSGHSPATVAAFSAAGDVANSAARRTGEAAFSVRAAETRAADGVAVDLRNARFGDALTAAGTAEDSDGITDGGVRSDEGSFHVGDPDHVVVDRRTLEPVAIADEDAPTPRSAHAAREALAAHRASTSPDGRRLGVVPIHRANTGGAR